MKKTYQLTAEGKAELEAELEELKSRRGEIADKIAEARDYGDLSENAEYAEARNEQGQVEGRIAEIEDILVNASLISTTGRKASAVKLGVTVEMKNKQNGKAVSYTVVGSVEADPTDGKISDQSPIGRALLGKKVGETANILTPSGEVAYEIVSLG